MKAQRIPRFVLAFGLILLPVAAGAQSATTGSIAGVVRDTTGAVLPGVTVEAASPALIEKVRTAVTDAQGNYKIVDLRPGTYAVTFTLTGFGRYVREGLELTTGVTANINADLTVGTIEETVTVTGASPVVDIQNVRRQTVISREVMDALPVAKNLQSYVGLTLGARFTTATAQDVGGNQGEAGGFGSFSVHGGQASSARFLIDGMAFYAIIGSGCACTRTNYVNQMAIQETTFTTGGIGAEAETGGVQINVVPKDGGNTFSGSVLFNHTNSSLQSDNLDDALIARGVTASPKVKSIYDQGIGFGGPLKRDKIWFYTAHRRWGTLNTIPGNFFNKTPHTMFYTPDLDRPAFSWIHNRDHQGRLTWQVNPKQKLSISQGFQWDVNEFWNVLQNVAPEAASVLYWHPNSLTQVTWNYPRTNRLLFEVGSTALWELQDDLHVREGVQVTKTDIPILELSTNYQYGARATGMLNQVDYGLGSTVHISTSRFATSYITGSHAFKVGYWNLYSWAQTVTVQNEIPGLGPVSYQFLNARPFAVVQWRSPLRRRTRPFLQALYAQDQWTLRRLTLNLGARWDNYDSWVPAEEFPAMVFAPALSLAKQEHVPDWHDITPRLGAAYDVFGNGKTAIKASLGKYMGVQDIRSVGAPTDAVANRTNRNWNDANGDYFPNCDLANPLANGECGPWQTPNFGLQFTPSTVWDPELLTGWGERDYSWQGTVTMQQELRPSMALNVGYYRTWYGQFRVTTNRALTAVGFDEYCTTAPVDPRLGDASGKQFCGLSDPKRIVAPNNLVTFAKDFGKRSDVYNGFEVSLQMRFGRGLLQGGVSSGRTVQDQCDLVRNNLQIGFSGSRNTDDFCRGVTPWNAQTQVKVLGSYPLPGDVQVSGTFQHLPGVPILANLRVTGAQTTLGRGLTTGSTTVPVIVSNTQFEDRMNQLDVRFAKNFRFGRYRLQGQFDVYNMFNANSVLGINTQYGATWLRPTAVLGARLFKFGGQFDF